MTIVDKIISVNYSTGRGGKQPIRITCHTCVCSATSLYSWFNTPTTKASTSFYVNKNGVVERYVKDTDTAWGNSNFDSNQRSFSFETYDGGNPNDAVRTNELYESASQLVAYLCKTYQIPCVLVPKSDATNWNVKGIDLHNYFANKSCPAALNVQRIIDRANLILNSQPMVDPQIKQYSQNLLGRTTDQQSDEFETDAWVKEGQDYGKWFNNFRQNQEVKNFQITTLLADNAELTNDNAVLTGENNKLKEENLELQKTVSDQQGVIADQLDTIKQKDAEIVELNKALDGKDTQIKQLQTDLATCQAGNTEPDIVIRIWIRIKQLFKGA